MANGNDDVGVQINAMYRRLMSCRADEISMLKKARLARQQREREEELRRLEARRRAVQARFESFLRNCMLDA